MSGTADHGTDAPVGDPLGDDPAVRAWLGDAFPVLRRFADLLAHEGVVRGLIGPREVPRLWERHLLNSAAVAPLLPAGVVADVGSGAGLPGVVIAALRPDVRMVLVESMLRRATWLTEVTAELGLDVEVRRARAEDLHGSLLVDAVTARAVAPLPRLVGWTLPLLRPGGLLIALKGDQAVAELAEAQVELTRLGADAGEVVDADTVRGVPAARVVRVVKLAEPVPARRRRG